jgi:hypothetical protein
MENIFKLSTSRCGIVENLGERFVLVRNFLSTSPCGKIMILTKQIEKWKKELSIFKQIIIIYTDILIDDIHSDFIFIDVDVEELDFRTKWKLMRSPSFLWFLSFKTDFVEVIIKYKLITSGVLQLSDMIDQNIVLKKKNPLNKFKLSFYFDDCVEVCKYDVKIKISSDLNLNIPKFCNICFEKKTHVGITNCCKKYLCKTCIGKWFFENKKCPYCRSEPTIISCNACNCLHFESEEKCLFIGKDKNRFPKCIDKIDRSIYELDFTKIIVDAVTFKDDIWDIISLIDRPLEICYII